MARGNDKSLDPNDYTTGPKGVYRDWITPERLKIIEGWARDGLSNKQIAKNIGIHVSTLYEWRNDFPELNDAIKKGKEVIDREVENALLKRALGHEIEETKTYMTDDGKGGKTKRVEKIKKQIPSDATSMIFWLKNRKPDEWNDRRQVEHSGEMTTNVNMFKDLTTEELRALANKEIQEDE